MTQSLPQATTEIIPLAEEEVVVGKVETETGRVRVRVLPVEYEAMVEASLATTSAEVERVPVGRMVKTTPKPRWDGDTYVVPIVEEVLVTEKKLRLIEEVRIRRRTTAQTFSQPVTVRRSEVVIERVEPATGHIDEPARPSQQPPET